MLYVIDQRLKAQGISLEKSAQGMFFFCWFLSALNFTFQLIWFILNKFFEEIKISFK